MACRRQAPRGITNVVLTRNELELFDCTPREIYAVMNDPMQWLQWLAEHRLIIRNTNDCGVCKCQWHWLDVVSRLNCSRGNVEVVIPEQVCEQVRFLRIAF